jgi:hypothetical protein
LADEVEFFEKLGLTRRTAIDVQRSLLGVMRFLAAMRRSTSVCTSGGVEGAASS